MRLRRLIRPLSHLSIQSKVIGIILLTNLVGLGVAMVLIVKNDIKFFHREMQSNCSQLADAIARYHVIALLFDDIDDSRDSLRIAEAYDHLMEVYVYDGEGELFNHVVTEDPDLDPPNLMESLSGFKKGGVLEIYRPVIDQEEYLGTVVLRFSTEQLDLVLKEYRSKMLAVVVIVLIISVVFSFMLGHFISGPILQLAEVARRISRDGDYSIRVRKIGRDEIAILCDVFNDMLSQIQSRQLELERSNRELDNFAYVASHDLKAPLRAISTLAYWIEEDLEGKMSQESVEQLELLRGRVQRMEGLINGILEYSRVGRINADLVEVDVAELLHEIVEMLGIPEEFQVDIEPPVPVFEARRLRLQQVFSNLISNAYKYHDRLDGQVLISCQERDEEYEFTVADDGPGIAPEYQRKVFLIFQTLQSRDEVESTGVGLALVQKIIETEGGRITLESELGKGSTFCFTWPKTPQR
ncbi:MAG: ATP-binding protein [Acidobacteriota bacterium]